MVEIYTDGASRGNPGPGGYGTILKFGNVEKSLSEGYRLTTNNRMELLAVIKGLEALTKKNIDVLVVSDSKYVVDSVEKGWVFGWEKKNFKKKKNPDLWKRYLALEKSFNIRFKWIKGHNDHPYNERCDQLAVEASQWSDLEIDRYYEEEVYGKE